MTKETIRKMMRQRKGKAKWNSCPRVIWLGLFGLICLPANILRHSSSVVEARKYDQRLRNLMLLGETKNERCIENLLFATSQYDYMLEVPAYLKFIEYQSNGLIKRSKFDVGIMELVHIYWLVICTVSSEMCYRDTSVMVQDVLGYEESDGGLLIDNLCSRVDLYLERLEFKINELPVAISSIPPSIISSSATPMQTPTVWFDNMETDKPATGRPKSDVPTIDANGSASNQYPASQNLGELTSFIPTSASLSNEITIELGPYNYEFDAICLDKEFYHSAKNKSVLRSVFYDETMETLKDALNCTSSWCQYEIFLIASFDSFAFDAIEATVKVSVNYSVYVNTLDHNFLTTSTIEQVVDDLMLSDKLRNQLTSATSCESSSPTLSVHPSDSPSNMPLHNPTMSSQPSVSSAPSANPTVSPTSSLQPTTSIKPSHVPSLTISSVPSTLPSHSTLPSTTPSVVPSAIASNIPSSSNVPSNIPSSNPSVTPSIVPSISTSQSPSSQSLFQVTFSIEYLSQCVSEVIYSFVNAAVKDYFNCSSSHDCAVTYSFSVSLLPFACLDQLVTDSEHSCALVDLTFNAAFESDVNSTMKNEFQSVVQQAVRSNELNVLINSESSCSPSVAPSASLAPSATPNIAPSIVPSVLASLVPSRIITSAPTYGDSISLFFSIEYLINDVQKVLEDSLNEIVSGVIDNEYNCTNNSSRCKDISFSLTVSIYEQSRCFDPVDTSHKCAFVDLMLILKSEDPLDSLRETLTIAFKDGLSNGTIDKLINSPSS